MGLIEFQLGTGSPSERWHLNGDDEDTACKQISSTHAHQKLISLSIKNYKKKLDWENLNVWSLRKEIMISSSQSLNDFMPAHHHIAIKFKYLWKKNLH